MTLSLASNYGPAVPIDIGFVPWGPIGIGIRTQTLRPEMRRDSWKDLRSGFDRFTPATAFPFPSRRIGTLLVRSGEC